jgi:hypothetical protein
MLVEIPIHYIPDFNTNSHALFDNVGFVIGMIFAGALISIIPGCGPNLVFTS